MIKFYNETFNHLRSLLLSQQQHLSSESTSLFLKQFYQLNSPYHQYSWSFSPFCQANPSDFNEWLPQLQPLQQIKKEDFPQNESFIYQFYYSGKENFVLSLNGKIYFINQCYKGIQNISGLILCSENIQCLAQYALLCASQKKVIPLYTTEQIWKKMASFLEYIWNKDITKLFSRECKLFKNRESQSLKGEVTLLFINRFWFEVSFDLILLVNGKKYLFVGKGIKNEEKQIYFGWKKQIITEKQYCQFIDEELTKDCFWNSSSQLNSLQIFQTLPSPQNYEAKLYENFCNTDLFLLLPHEIIEEIYFCGEIRETFYNCVLYKEGTICSDIFIVLDGVCQIEGGQSLYPSAMFGEDVLLNQCKKTNKTLKCKSEKGLFFCINLQVFEHLLHNYKGEMESIWQKSGKKGGKQLLLGILKNNSQKKGSSEKKKRIKANGSYIEISVDLWERVCSRSLEWVI